MATMSGKKTLEAVLERMRNDDGWAGEIRYARRAAWLRLKEPGPSTSAYQIAHHPPTTRNTTRKKHHRLNSKDIDAAGASALAEMLKTNTGVKYVG